MQKLFWLMTIMLVVSSLSVAQRTPAPSTAPATIANSTISGRISSKEKALRGITVNLTRNGGSGGRGGQSVKTDEDGKFKFTNVAAGNYIVTPNAMAFVPDSSDVAGPFRGKSVVVSENENIENIDISMRTGGVVTGKILRPDGAPAIEQRVTLSTKNADGTTAAFFSASTTGMNNVTDDRGVFRLFGIPAGQYVVSAGNAQGGNQGGFANFRQRYPLTYFPGVSAATEAQTIEVVEGNETKDVEFRLGEPLPTFEARGKVVDAMTGTPVVGAQLTYRQVVANRRGGGGPQMNASNVRTDMNGEFVLDGIEKGSYQISLQSDGNSEYYSEQTSFEIADADAANIEVRASRGATINGFVVIDGAQNQAAIASSGMAVSASSQSQNRAAGRPGVMMPGGRGGIGEVAPTGAFQVKGLQPGKANLSVMNRSDARYSVVRIERDGADVTSGFEVASGEQVNNVRIIVAQGNGVIRGQINVVGGTLPAGTRLMVSAMKANSSGGRGMGNNGAQVDQNGKFVIEGLVPGQYTVTAIAFPGGAFGGGGIGGGRPVPGGGAIPGGGFGGAGVRGGRGGAPVGGGGGTAPTTGVTGGGTPQLSQTVKPVSQTVMLNGAEASVVLTLDVSAPPAGVNQ